MTKMVERRIIHTDAMVASRLQSAGTRQKKSEFRYLIVDRETPRPFTILQSIHGRVSTEPRRRRLALRKTLPAHRISPRVPFFRSAFYVQTAFGSRRRIGGCPPRRRRSVWRGPQSQRAGGNDCQMGGGGGFGPLTKARRH